MVGVVRLGDLNNRRGAEPCLERVMRLEEVRARVESLGSQTLEATVVMTIMGESMKCRNGWGIGMSKVESGVKKRDEMANTKGRKKRKARLVKALGGAF